MKTYGIPPRVCKVRVRPVKQLVSAGIVMALKFKVHGDVFGHNSLRALAI